MCKLYVGGKARRKEGRCLMTDMKWFVRVEEREE